MSVERRAAVIAVALLLSLGLGLLPVSSVVAARPGVPVLDEVIYVVKSGDRLADIAARFGASASAIMAANGITNADLIYPGQRLTIPSAAASAGATSSPPPSSTSGATSGATTPGPLETAAPTATGPVYHTVAPGETLDRIARRYGVTAAAVIGANNLANPDVIYVGQKLLISGGSAAASPKPALTPTSGATASSKPAAAARPAPIKQTTYVIQPGDTLAKIGQKYGVSVAALVSANGLGSADVIRAGQRLIIPGKGVTTYPGRATKFVTSISRQRCWLYQGDTVIAEWACSTGRKGNNTRPGTFKVQSKLQKAYGSTWNIWMPYWLGIYWAGGSENGIHGLPWNATTGVQVWTGYVGTPITYGCIMLDNTHAKMLYDMAYIGMPVIVNP